MSAKKPKNTILCLNKNIWMLEDLDDKWKYKNKWINRYWICDREGKDVSQECHYQVSGCKEQYATLKAAKYSYLSRE